MTGKPLGSFLVSTKAYQCMNARGCRRVLMLIHVRKERHAVVSSSQISSMPLSAAGEIHYRPAQLTGAVEENVEEAVDSDTLEAVLKKW